MKINDLTYESFLFVFSSRLIEGTRVIYEVQTNTRSGISLSNSGKATSPEEHCPRSGPELPSPGHNDVITDLLMCKTQKYPVLISSSRDGVIKLWK